MLLDVTHNFSPNSTITAKLDRLRDTAQELQYSGVDPNTILSGPVVAIVGTRKPTPYGKQMTEAIATELARAGVTVISGLAFGVDIIAAKATLSEHGTTVAVLPSGLDKIYPASHAKIAAHITEQGSLLSEFPSGHSPRRHDFLHRNRLVAALSDAVIIPEAAQQSGSLNTARHAHEMGIPVYVVPGHVTSPLSEGTHQLVKDGKATIITSAQDVLQALNIDATTARTHTGNTPQETAIIQAIQDGHHDSALIQAEAGLNTSEFQVALTMLEIDGKVIQDELGKWHLHQ